MHPVMERAAERQAKRDRTMPKVSGLAGGNVTGELSTGHWRTSRKQGHQPFVATTSKRFGVKPSGGKVADIYAGTSTPGKDDGSGYFDEWRAQGGTFSLPVPKTRMQDHLHRLCVAYIAGEELGKDTEDRMREFIAKIVATDPDHGNAWRLAMGVAGLYK